MTPELNIKLHKAFGHIGYVDAPHKYYDLNTRKQLISVTTLIGKYKQKFNSDYWSKKKAKDYGTTPEKVLNYWDKLRILGTTRGSILHDYLENRCYNKIFEIDYDMYLPYLDTSEFIQFHKKQSKLITMADNYIKDHSHIIPIKPELIVGNKKVAGQVDFFGYNIDTNNYTLVDFKTDKKIDYTNKYQSFKSFLSHLEECEINKYSLQIKTYEKLLNSVVEHIEEKYIVWFNADNDNYKKINIKELDDEAELLLANC